MLTLAMIASPAYIAAAPQHLFFAGRERTFRVYRPASLSRDAAVPLVVVLHGGFGSGAQAEKSYGWDAAADRHRFVVVYPDGVNHAWNAGTCCGKPQRREIDDVGFLSALIREISVREHIDSTRVAVTGMSNGAMMAYRMACESPVHLRAIGSVSGTMLVPCLHPQRTSVMEIHGISDHNVPYEGGKGQGPAGVQTPPIPGVVAHWRAIDDCDPPQTHSNGVVTIEQMTCSDALAVELIAIAGAGHQWPGGKPASPEITRFVRALGISGIDPPSTALDATETLYRFFFEAR
ncbi:MAG TPA: alpha/beta fold hydrolase [Candidatus Baltobacteraceae bacterium]|nr:alpha/beta fold hydrolase [Candidatus Baltobacteraceae bacterium]